MPTLAVIGSQWGDEGKGKITDYLAEDADLVVRYQGGANAGHTIKVGNEVFALHLLPSGIIREGVLSVIGNGVVVDCDELRTELEMLRKTGRTGDMLRISDRANVVLPYHRMLDGAEERARGAKGVGTTGRGIGPCYADTGARAGTRTPRPPEQAEPWGRLAARDPLKEKLVQSLGIKLEQEKASLLGTLLEYGNLFRPYITDTSVLINDAIKDGKKVMFEGAQGTMLDIDYGTYPFVTSSNCTAAGICTGAGVPPSAIQDVVGVTKAYTTRVGAGPFVTELHDAVGLHLQNVGGEFGTTTGRPRRCGWLDMMVVRHAVRLNGMTSMAMTKLDVLSDLPVLKVCVAYEIDGQIVEDFPGSIFKLARAKPIYEELEGWSAASCNPAEIKRKGYGALPKNMRKYLDFITTNAGVPIEIISFGKGRDETIDLRKRRWSE